MNDTSAADFTSILHALLINKYTEQFKSDSKLNNNNLFKRKLNKVLKSNDSFYAPSELDFAHILEFDLKQCLCVNELTTMFRPKELALTVLIIQLERLMNAKKDNSIENQMKMKFYKEFIEEALNLLKINYETIIECKDKATAHLVVMEKNKKLMDSYLSEYFFEMARTYHTTKSLNWFSALAAVTNAQLTAIKEEDEDELNREEKSEDIFTKQSHDLLKLTRIKVC